MLLSFCRRTGVCSAPPRFSRPPSPPPSPLRPQPAWPRPPARFSRKLRSFREMGTVLLSRGPSRRREHAVHTIFRAAAASARATFADPRDGGQNETRRDFDAKLGHPHAGTARRPAVRRRRQFFTARSTSATRKVPRNLRFWTATGARRRGPRHPPVPPDVIVTRFPIPAGQWGHGHHTASAILAVEASARGPIQGISEQLTQGLTVWQPKRVVWNDFGQAAVATADRSSVQLGHRGQRPVTANFGTIANRSRACTRRRGWGIFRSRRRRPNMQSFMLLAGEPFAAPGASPGDGRDGPRAPSRAATGSEQRCT